MVQTVEDISLMQKLLDDSVTYAKSFPKTGAVASYIPERGNRPAERQNADFRRYGCPVYDAEYLQGGFADPCTSNLWLRRSVQACGDGADRRRLQLDHPAGD